MGRVGSPHGQMVSHRGVGSPHGRRGAAMGRGNGARRRGRDAKPRTAPEARRRDGDIAPYRNGTGPRGRQRGGANGEKEVPPNRSGQAGGRRKIISIGGAIFGIPRLRCIRDRPECRRCDGCRSAKPRIRAKGRAQVRWFVRGGVRVRSRMDLHALAMSKG